MYHSITFGDKNTWTDWHIVPSSRPVVSPPGVKTHYIEIPGADGSIDLTDSLAGRPAFSDREGSFDFVVLNDYDISGYQYNWINVYTTIMQYLHGKTMRMILEDDPIHYYEGRFSVNSWKSDQSRSSITIDYRVGPYKYEITPEITASMMETGDINNETGEDQPLVSYGRLKVPAIYAAPGSYIKFDRYRNYDAGLTPLQIFFYHDAAATNYDSYINKNGLEGLTYTFTSERYFRFTMVPLSGEVGPAVTDAQLAEMASVVHFYKGGVL